MPNNYWCPCPYPPTPVTPPAQDCNSTAPFCPPADFCACQNFSRVYSNEICGVIGDMLYQLIPLDIPAHCPEPAILPLEVEATPAAVTPSTLQGTLSGNLSGNLTGDVSLKIRRAL